MKFQSAFVSVNNVNNPIQLQPGPLGRIIIIIIIIRLLDFYIVIGGLVISTIVWKEK